MARFFEDTELGDQLGPLEKVATDQHVVQFVSVWQPSSQPSRFTSEEVARKEGLPGAIIPGIMSMAFLSQLLTGWSPSLRIQKLDVIFRQPVPHNQPLKLSGVVTDKTVQDGQGLLEVDVSLETPDGEKRVTGKATVALPLRGA
ncbi:MAG: hypothetical protein HY686_04245 [Chloroflexi bacterium]|nr:hypothetical protein [Chloroflexota bacterium]